ncbi:MAG TPA: arylsulfatase [Solirubrobacteraceae bacterium]|nr:arylsulfatase [Solirubrobacteraceae bacterium]
MPDRQPNLVFILADNIGWGDFACYGGNTQTPRIDHLASEGIRFNNYNVEAQCTPTRSAILTGRQAVRSGTYAVPLPGQGKSGLTPWEYTLAELLSDAGYATSLWGKWHLGDTEGRLPTDQGFDEWWGYRNSADECGWTSYATFDAIAKAKGIEAPQLWEAKKGGPQTAVRELNMEVRPLLDELIVEKATQYIKRQAQADKPFFTYIALSHMHPPEAAHPDFDQTSPDRLGGYADVIAEMDHRVGQIVDCVEEAGIAENTMIVFSSDNAAGEIPAFAVGGSNGPWRGDFFTPPTEGSMRVPAMVRWPGKVTGGVITEEMLSAHDWYETFAALAGASDKVPTDRPMDGVDVSKFLLGESESTGREHILFFGPDGSLMSVKWHNIKAILRYSEGDGQPIVTPQFPLLFDLGSDPGERYSLFHEKMDMGWMFGVCMQFITAYQKSIAQYPNIKPGWEFDGYPESQSTG